MASRVHARSPITLNTGWHHLAFVRNGFTLKLFIDGVQEARRGVSAARSTIQPTRLRVGALRRMHQPTPGRARIDEFRISVGIARWTDNFTPPRVPYLQCRRAGVRALLRAHRDRRLEDLRRHHHQAADVVAGGLDRYQPHAGGAYNVPPTELWSFEQSGTKLVAVNINDDPQVVDIDAGGNFAVLAGLAAARRTRQADRRFSVSVRGSTPAAASTIVASSGRPSTTSPAGPSALNLCDMQEFPDGGPVQGVAGAEIGYVVQDRTIRTMQFLPGDTTFIFNFSRVLHDRGCVSKYGFTSIGNVLYFVAEDGFYSAQRPASHADRRRQGQRVVPGQFRYHPARCRALPRRREQAADGVGVSCQSRRRRCTTSRSSLIGRMAAGPRRRSRRRSGACCHRPGSISIPTGAEYQDALLDSAGACRSTASPISAAGR